MEKEVPKFNLKILLISVIVVALIIAAIYYLVPRGDNEPVEVAKEDMPEIAQIGEDKLPNKIPDDLPMEDGAEIIQNFEARKLDEGKYQSTRKYKSQKSVGDLFVDYNNYFLEKKWQVLDTLSEETFAVLAAETASQENILVHISENTVTHQVTVDITVSY